MGSYRTSLYIRPSSRCGLAWLKRLLGKEEIRGSKSLQRLYSFFKKNPDELFLQALLEVLMEDKVPCQVPKDLFL